MSTECVDFVSNIIKSLAEQFKSNEQLNTYSLTYWIVGESERHGP